MGARIVVIEDDSATLRLLGTILRSSDMESIPFTNAEDALERLPHERPNVVICDQNLPGMTGVAFVAILRTTAFARTPVMLMSAYEEPKQHAANIFLGKPFDPFRLAEIVERMAKDGKRSPGAN
jgi:CheY-like chemotaxis protein